MSDVTLSDVIKVGVPKATILKRFNLYDFLEEKFSLKTILEYFDSYEATKQMTDCEDTRRKVLFSDIYQNKDIVDLYKKNSFCVDRLLIFFGPYNLFKEETENASLFLEKNNPEHLQCIFEVYGNKFCLENLDSLIDFGFPREEIKKRLKLEDALFSESIFDFFSPEDLAPYVHYGDGGFPYTICKKLILAGNSREEILEIGLDKKILDDQLISYVSRSLLYHGCDIPSGESIHPELFDEKIMKRGKQEAHAHRTTDWSNASGPG